MGIMKEEIKLKDFICPKCGCGPPVSWIDVQDAPDDPCQLVVTVEIRCNDCGVRYGFGRRFEKEK